MHDVFERVEGRSGTEILITPMFRQEGFIAAFTTRKGGWSPPPFDGLNMGYGVPDARENVYRNRQCVLSFLGLNPCCTYSMRLVHGARIMEAGVDGSGEGLIENGGFPETDGLFTSAREVALLGTFADCVPVFLADVRNRKIGLVHAGWRGTAQRASAALAGSMGMTPDNAEGFIAAIGPSIGPCCYEVGKDVADAVANASGRECVRITCDRTALDLGMANEMQLMSLGMRRERISRYAGCTSCKPCDFFSHRRDKGLTGRMAAIAAIMGE